MSFIIEAVDVSVDLLGRSAAYQRPDRRVLPVERGKLPVEEDDNEEYYKQYYFFSRAFIVRSSRFLCGFSAN